MRGHAHSHPLRTRHWVAALILAGVAGAAAARAADDNAGFLYGRVVTESDNSYTGILRWGDEEAFWDDLFNSAKTNTPDWGGSDDNGRQARTIDVFGRKITFKWGSQGSSRQFVTRFGDIDRIEVQGMSKARLLMRDGSTFDVAGSANDVEATIEVRDPSVGSVQVPWRKIKTIQFLPTPSSAEAPGFRLVGTVYTTAGTFKGPIQWDKQECISVDKLDGEEDDIKVSLPMGNIAKIERNGHRGSRVTLRDGRTMNLTGTNDVDDDNRGILVEDSRYGRVEVPWGAFDRLELEASGGSGRGYGEFGKYGPLHGRVVAKGQKSYSGRLVFDLDEAFGWEMLDGNKGDIIYSIPMGMVARVEPRNSSSALVRLHNGEELVLSDTQDVSDSNDGVLIVPAEGSDGVRVAWDDIESIELDR